jgi:hypothetical protein
MRGDANDLANICSAGKHTLAMDGCQTACLSRQEAYLFSQNLLESMATSKLDPCQVHTVLCMVHLGHRAQFLARSHALYSRWGRAWVGVKTSLLPPSCPTPAKGEGI